MPLEWTPALAVGIEEIDEQHRELFRRARQLVEGIRRGGRHLAAAARSRGSP